MSNISANSTDVKLCISKFNEGYSDTVELLCVNIKKINK